MKPKRIISLLLALVLACGLLPTAALAATTTVNKITITMTKPTVGKALPTDAQTSSTGSTHVTDVQWAGATDNGLMRGDAAYTATFTIEIKPDKDAKFTTNTINTTVNGGSTGVSVTRVSNTQVRVTYTIAAGGAPATGVTNFTIHTSVPRVGVALNKSASTSGSSNVEVTSVEWTGERDSVGRVKTDTAYTLTLNVKIKDKNNAVFSPRGVTPYINDTSTPATFTRLSDTTGIVTYTFPIISSDEREAEQKAKQDAITAQEHADELARRWSLAEAEAARPQNNPITIVVNESALDMDRFSRILPNIDTGAYWKGWESKDRGTPITNFLGGVGDKAHFTTLDGQTLPINDENERRITRVVYDFYWPIDFSLAWYPNVTELWLSPQCDIEGILNNIAHDYFGGDGDHRQFYTYNHTVFIPDSVYPSGPPAYLGDIHPGCRVMLYSGSDVYAAVKKGASAARDWCTNHSYTAQILTPDRWYSDISCYDGTRYYYSCVRCGKCEYNPNHTFFSNEWVKRHGGAGAPVNTTAHAYRVKTLTDEHFVGIDANGDRVYLYACEYCGRDKRYHDINMTFEEYKSSHGSNSTQAAWQTYVQRLKGYWAEGGSNYEKALKASIGQASFDCYTVPTATYVTATTSGWAREDVNAASEEGLIDKSLLGNNYTATVTRLQFVSIAVKMAEKMTGKSITPAPSGTFTDTDNEYVRKAYTAGITTGNGDGTFTPNGTLTRQQMATFLYRTLQYVKDNSDTEYSIYDSKLGSYSDASQLAGWAVDAMAFMNALGLIKGISDTTLAPNNPCTIEQAVIAALRSLDAGMLGWYQYDGDIGSIGYMTSYNRYTNYVNWGKLASISNGERVFVTAITRHKNQVSQGVYETSYYGNFVDSYGRSALVNLENCRAIKDR